MALCCHRIKKYKIFKLNEDSLIENIFKTAYNWSEDSINKLNNVIIKKTDNEIHWK